MDKQPYIAGVYRTEDQHTLGEGGHAQSAVQYLKWFVIGLDGMRFVVQPLSSRDLPSAMFTVVTADDFRRKYLPDPLTFQKLFYHCSIRYGRNLGASHLKANWICMEM